MDDEKKIMSCKHHWKKLNFWERKIMQPDFNFEPSHSGGNTLSAPGRSCVCRGFPALEL